MFNNRNKDEGQFGVLNAHPSTSANSKSNVSTHSVVDECLTMKGDLESEGNILVKGKAFGNIKCEVLIIDADALVEGGVNAKEVIIRGKMNGTIQANRVSLEKTADVESEICHDTFSAEEGARIKGALRLNEDPLGGQTNTVKAKEGVRNKSALPSTEEVTSGQSEEVGASSA